MRDLAEEIKVCVCGLGTVGLPTAEYLGEFFEVYGYDLRQIKGSNFVYVDGFLKRHLNVDVYVVCVPTSQVENICRNFVEKDKLVLVESTMQFGICRKIAEDLSIKLLAHCPHRYWKEESLNHGVKQFRVLGAINRDSLNLALEFYQQAKIPVYSVSSIEVAELSKLIENANRFVNIAFVEEIKMICDEIGIRFEEIRQACNTKWNIQLLEARDGIKGTCLPKDIEYLRRVHVTPLLDGAVEIDKMYQRMVEGDSEID